MEILHKEYRQTGTNKGKHDSEILKLLNIPNEQDVGTLNDSRFLQEGVDGTHIIFRLSSDGIRYMDYFYGLQMRKYEDLGGAIRNGYMESPDKRERAHQWAKEHMAEIVSGISRTAQIHEQGAKTDEEVLKLSPEFYGIGVNLKALWRRVFQGGNYSALGIVFILVGTLIMAIPLLDPKKNINDDYIVQMNQQTGEYTQNKHLTDIRFGTFGFLFIILGTAIEIREKLTNKKSTKV